MDEGTPYNSQQNPRQDPKVYVKFGPHPTDEMPLEWAEKVLTAWREKSPAQFGKALAAVVTGGR
jgi:hypothetical protein